VGFGKAVSGILTQVVCGHFRSVLFVRKRIGEIAHQVHYCQQFFFDLCISFFGVVESARGVRHWLFVLQTHGTKSILAAIA
jgi:hypothetical protein